MIVGMTLQRRTPEELLGDAIRARRAGLGWSQEDFALACGLHRTYISQLERGKKSPTLRTLCMLARALKVSIVNLVRSTTTTDK